MRILLLSERLSAPLDEGIKNLAMSLADALRAEHKVLVLTAFLQGEPATGVELVVTDRLFRAGNLRRRVADFRPELVVYIPTASATPASFRRAASLAAAAGGAPLAFVVTQARRHNVLAQLLMRLGHPHNVFTFAESTAASLRALGLQPTSLPVGVDTARFTPASPAQREALRARFGLPARATVLLHVGHINANRNVPSLAALISDQRRLLIVGSTSTPADHAVADALRSAGATIVRAYLPNVADVYRLADCYVFPSVSATGAIDLPLSVLEAMACNLRVASTPFGGLPALLAEGDGLAYVQDGERLASTVERALAANIVRTREKVLPLSWQAVAQRLVAETMGRGQ